MGRFSCLVVVLVAACADNPVDVPDQAGADDVTVPDGIDTVLVPRLAPTVCGVAEWPDKVLNPKVDLSVATRDTNAAIVSMPIGGGDARGMLVNARMAVVSDQSIATSYDQVGISYAANRFAATTRHDGSIGVWMMADDLSSSDLLTTVEGTVTAKQTFVPIPNGLIMPVGDAYGVTIHRFKDSYEPVASYRLPKAGPVLGMAATSSSDTALIAWTTDANCFIGQLDGYNVEMSSPKWDACQNPRLAVDSGSLTGVLVFDSPEGVRLSMTDGTIMYGRDLLRANATAPRVLFDGSKFWVSFLDDRGQVVVGILDTATRHVRTIAVSGPRPFASSYELAMVEGSPWVFTLDETGYAGHRLCVEQY
jgi:hypothetical protein